MELKQYLIDTFKFNDYANKLVLKKIKELPEKDEAINLFSHIINAQNKWLARILQDLDAHTMSPWNPVYNLDELEIKWNESLKKWIDFLESKSEEELFEEILFIAVDGEKWHTILKDIPLQLNYHSIHHRAQIQSIIRKQGLKPDSVDYIGTVYKKIE
ncbi:MAG: DinB family protein [Ignavibacteriaceae bacterium]|jgi:uncharacterized damage-inducible protein DinB